jgi:hypothetical protein
MTTQQSSTVKDTILFAYYSELANAYFIYKSMRNSDNDYTLKYRLTCKCLPADTPPEKDGVISTVGSKVSDWRGNMYEILSVKEI